MRFDLEAIEGAVRTILSAIGEDGQREGLQETPASVARMCAEVFAGLDEDPSENTSAVRGSFRTDRATRTETLALLAAH